MCAWEAIEMAASRVKAKRAPAEAKEKKRAPGSEVFKPYFSIGEAIATLFHPFAEVVLHDLRNGRIVRIWNCRTDRKPGELSRLNRAQDLFSEEQAVLGPYEKALPSQGRTKSITAGLRDEQDTLIGFLCINLDVTVIDQATAMLAAFASSGMKRPEPIYRNDLQQHVSYLVRDYSVRTNKPVDHLTKQERVELVGIVDAAGLFQARKSVELLAKAMQISRATVYNLLGDANRLAKSKPKSPAGQPRKDQSRNSV
jgi:predicted transcriptional regulator YheO